MPSSNQRGDTAGFALLIAILLTGGVLVFSLSGSSKGTERKAPDIPKATVEQLNYHGSVLECINFAQTESIGGNSFDCDFSDYYRREQLKESIKPTQDTPKAVIVKVRYQGKPLECVQIERENTDVRAASCDYEAYHQA